VFLSERPLVWNFQYEGKMISFGFMPQLLLVADRQDDAGTGPLKVRLVQFYTSFENRQGNNKPSPPEIADVCRAGPFQSHQSPLGRAQFECVLTCRALEGALPGVKVASASAVFLTSNTAMLYGTRDPRRKNKKRVNQRPATDSDYYEHVIPWDETYRAQEEARKVLEHLVARAHSHLAEAVGEVQDELVVVHGDAGRYVTI
jgi:hypothetical protein